MKTLVSLVLSSSTALFACGPQGTPSTAPASTPPAAGDAAPPAGDEDLEGRPVVANPEAKPGDVTECPYSGRKFVVKEDSPTFEYEGETWVLCSEKAKQAVAADPAKYLGTAGEGG